MLGKEKIVDELKIALVGLSIGGVLLLGLDLCFRYC